MDFLRSGGVYFGGFLAVASSVRFYRLSFLRVADAFAPGVALGQAIGRLGCFAAGDSSGKPTDWPWGVYFTELAHTNTGVSINATDGSNLYLYPTQLYESFTMFAVFRLLVYLHRHKRLDGYVLIVRTHLPGSTLYIEFLRDDLRGDLLGLTTVTGLSTSQLVSLLVVLGVLTFMILHPLKLGQL